MREDYFFEGLNIDELDKNRAYLYFKTKGLEKHILIKDNLKTWGVNNIDYPMIASTYRYDKRLRYILFKYISYIEEFYRAIILDEYNDNPKLIECTEDFNKRLQKYKYRLNDTLENISYKVLLYQAKKMPHNIKKLFRFPLTKHLAKNIDALISLRNAVMHNKFLLLCRFGICYVDGIDDGKSASLKANILNLISFLPEDVGQKCKKEINEARKEGENTGTKWKLPSVVIIDLE